MIFDEDARLRKLQALASYLGLDSATTADLRVEVSGLNPSVARVTWTGITSIPVDTLNRILEGNA